MTVGQSQVSQDFNQTLNCSSFRSLNRLRHLHIFISQLCSQCFNARLKFYIKGVWSWGLFSFKKKKDHDFNWYVSLKELQMKFTVISTFFWCARSPHKGLSAMQLHTDLCMLHTHTLLCEADVNDDSSLCSLVVSSVPSTFTSLCVCVLAICVTWTPAKGDWWFPVFSCSACFLTS